MRSLYNFVIEPVEERYENTKMVDGKELILNTEMQNHEYVSRRGKVISTPINVKTGIKAGDEVILHHNVFRRMYNAMGNEKNSKSFFDEDRFFVFPDQIFMYKRKGEWLPVCGFCFIKPIRNSGEDQFNLSPEEELVGIVKYADCIMKRNGIKPGSKVGFKPHSEYEFNIDGEKLYRVPTTNICLIYGDSKGAA